MQYSPCRFCSALPGIVALVSALGLGACRTLEPDPDETPDGIDQATFATIDRDGDGKVSPREMAAFKHQEGLAEIDIDNDRRISTAEWKVARPSSADEDGLFSRLDLNRDGFLTEEEALADLLAQKAYLDGFRAMDGNGDGHLHWEEYAAGNPASLNLTLGAPTGTAP